MRSTFAGLLAVALVPALAARISDARPRPSQGVYATVAEARRAGPDFDIQGEYEGTVGGDADRKIGVQVIALGQSKFQAVFLPGGLPGAGWDSKSKILCQGKLVGGKVRFEPAAGQRRYLDGDPDRFSATATFPPAGQKGYTATIEGGRLTGKTDTGKAIEAKKVTRKSPTLGAKPPRGATVLLAYRPGKAPSLDAWTNAKWKTSPEGYMQVVQRSGSNRTRRSFEGPWKLHVEFCSPFQPRARGQQRGNSGVFPPGGREVQVLDSFGLDGKANECGGIYRNYPPSPNMCLPPLTWQTYDIEYRPAADGQPASYKVVHNGVVIHKKVPLGKGASRPLQLQDHGNPVSYRNIWIVLGK